MRILRKAYGVNAVFIWAALFALIALSLTVCRGDTAVSLSADYYRSFTRFFMYNYNAATGETYLGKTLSVQAPDYQFGQWRVPRGYSNEEIELPHARGYLLKKESGTHDRVVYQIHGGGFVSKFADTYNETAVLFSETCGGAGVLARLPHRARRSVPRGA